MNLKSKLLYKNREVRKKLKELDNLILAHPGEIDPAVAESFYLLSEEYIENLINIIDYFMVTNDKKEMPFKGTVIKLN